MKKVEGDGINMVSDSRGDVKGVKTVEVGDIIVELKLLGNNAVTLIDEISKVVVVGKIAVVG